MVHVHCDNDTYQNLIDKCYCKFGNFREGLFSRNFAKMKSSRNREITLSITDIGKPCPGREILTSLVCLLTLFAKIIFSRKLPDLQYQNSIKKPISMFYLRNDIMQKVLMG